jgi:hypothetical protein
MGCDTAYSGSPLQMCKKNFSLGEGGCLLTLWLYNLCLISKIYLIKIML